MLHTYSLDESLVCLDTRHDHVQVTNAVGARIWAAWLEGDEAIAISAQIAQEFDVSQPTALEDTTRFLTELAGNRYREVDPSLIHIPIIDFVPGQPLTPVEVSRFWIPGAQIIIKSELPGLVTLLRAIVPAGKPDDPAAKLIEIEVFDDAGRYPLRHNGHTVDTGSDREDTAYLCNRYIAGLLTYRFDFDILLHASSVAREGQALLFPADSGSGKSTLAAYLMAHGYTLLNDDFVALSSGVGHLCPVPLNVSVKQGSWDVLGSYFAQLADAPVFRANIKPLKYLVPAPHQRCQEPVPCAAIVLPAWSAHCPGPALEAISPVQVLEQVIDAGCIVARPYQPTAIAAVVNWLECTPCYRLLYTKLDDAAQLLERARAADSRS